LPDWYAQLNKVNTITTRALMFLILTIGRTSEVTLLNFDEIDTAALYDPFTSPRKIADKSI